MKHANTGIFLLLLLASSTKAQVPRFEENRGQWDACAKYLLRSGNVNLWITDSGMVYDLHSIQHSEPTLSFPRTRESRFREVYRMGLDSRLAPTLRGNDNYEHASGHDSITRIGHVVRMSFLHTGEPRVVASEAESGTTNYFIGSDPKKWATGVRSFQGVTVQNLYPGIDAVFSLDRGEPRYDLVIEPGSDPSQIEMAIDGADSIALAGPNTLVIRTSMGNIEEHALLAYQDADGVRRPVECAFQISDGNRISFHVGVFDRSKRLVIDPLIYSTYLGGSAHSYGSAIAVDRSGNAFVTGTTYATDFPVTAGAYQSSNNGAPGYNVFITKLNRGGTNVLYSTYLGGSEGNWGDAGTGIAIDTAGNAYVTGFTNSTDFPTTPGALQRRSKSTTYNYGNAFVAKLNATGTALLYSTYLGGSDGYFDGDGETASGIAVDSIGEAYVIGTSSSSDFPTTKGAFQTKNPAFSYNIESDGRSAFVTKLNARGNGLIYSTYLGGSKSPPPSLPGLAPSGGAAIALDRSGNAFVTGWTAAIDFPVTPGAYRTSNGSDEVLAFVTKLNASGTGLVYSTYLGGSGYKNTTEGDVPSGIAIDSVGEAFVTGGTESSDFPVTPGAFQSTNHALSNAFVTKLNAAGTALVYSTYLGGSGHDAASSIAIDRAGNALIAGSTSSSDFPVVPGVIEFFNPNKGYRSGFITKINTTGSSLIYSTYLGGSGYDQATSIAVDSGGSVFVTGAAGSPDFPITAGAFQTTTPDLHGSAFVTKLSPLTLYLVADSLHDLGVGSLCRVVDTTITLTNAGTDTLLIKHIELTGRGYAMAPQQDSVLLLPGATRTVILEYHPILVGSDTAILTVATNAANDSMMTIQFVARTGTTPLLHVLSALTKISVAASDTTTLLLSPDIAVSNLGLNSLEFTIHWNSDLLTPISITSAVPGANLSITSTTTDDLTSLHLTLTGTNMTLDPSQPIAQIVYQASIADSASSQIMVGNPVLNGGADSSYARCTLAASGSSTMFSLQFGCRDSLMMEALNQSLRFDIVGIYPDPASSFVRVESNFSGPASFELFDPLGRPVSSQPLLSAGDFIFDTHLLPDGVYTVVAKSNGQAVRGHFVIGR